MEAVDIFVKMHEDLRKSVEKLIATDTVARKTMHFEAGEYLFRKGEDTHCTFYVKRGLVKLSSENVGGSSKTLLMYKMGTFIGFQMFQGSEEHKPSVLSAKASVKTEVVAFDAKEFGAFLKEHGDVCYQITEYLFFMLTLQTREAVNSSPYSVLQRFAALLQKLAIELGCNEAPALIPFTNAELAEMLGVHANSVANAISSLRRTGCADKQRSYLAIIDFEKLRAAAESLL